MGWALVFTYDEGFETFYLFTPDMYLCMLTPDWKSDNKEDNIWGFNVSEDPYAGSCPFIEENGWTYSSYTYDEETQDPISLVGPWGADWYFYSEEDFQTQYPEWYADYEAMEDEEYEGEEVEFEPVWMGYLIDPYGSGNYSLLWIESEPMTELYYYNDVDEAYCVLKPDYIDETNPDEGVYGFFVTNPYGMCPYVAQGWNYTYYMEDQVNEASYLETPYG